MSEPTQPVVCLGSKPDRLGKKSLTCSGASCVLGAGTWEFCALWEGVDFLNVEAWGQTST